MGNPPTRLVAGGVFLTAKRGDPRLDLYYQRAPSALARGSLYYAIQKQHPFARAGALIPDFAFQINQADETRWLLVEVKGVERPVSDSARAALHDLLAYRRAFDPVLAQGPSPYGLGIAWGSSLPPASAAEISLCTPDTVEAALEQVFGGLYTVATVTYNGAVAASTINPPSSGVPTPMSHSNAPQAKASPPVPFPLAALRCLSQYHTARPARPIKTAIMASAPSVSDARIMLTSVAKDVAHRPKLSSAGGLEGAAHMV